MRTQLVQILLAACAILVFVGCDTREGSKPPAVPHPEDRAQPKPPNPGFNCDEFQQFYSTYVNMTEHKALLKAELEANNRLALASALLSDYLVRTYAIPASLRSNSSYALSIYLKLMNWIFTNEGNVRNRPEHPHTNNCLKEKS